MLSSHQEEEDEMKTVSRMMGIVAVVVYEKVGLGILRRGWVNMDLAWSLVLIASGAITLFTAL